MLEFLEKVIHTIVEYGEIFFAFLGVLVLLWTGVKGFILYLKKDRRTHLQLAHGMSMALAFLLGGEIIGSVIAHDWKSVADIGALVLLRTAIVVLLHWESRNEEKEIEHEEEVSHITHND